MNRFVGHIMLVPVIVAGLWLAGLIGFVMLTAALPTFNPDSKALQADAAVVLTGGSERITAGVQLLANKKVKRLFISGVFPGATLDHVLSGQNIDQQLRRCCIDLGYQAQNTAGNAWETATWVKKNALRSIVLVTANYHMARSMLEFRRYIPGLAIIPLAVEPSHIVLEDWWKNSSMRRLMIDEYTKLIVAFLRFAWKKLGG